MFEGRESTKRNHEIYLVLAISAGIACVNFSHSTIAVGESLEPILNKLLQESFKLIH